MSRQTPTIEDYLETIYKLTKSKGYAKIVDISEKLNVRPPTVTAMIQKLGERDFLRHEKYRDVSLTQRGEEIAKTVSDRHAKIMKFLTILGVDDKTAYADTEGIEHHMHPTTLKKIHELVLFAEKNPGWLADLKKFRKNKNIKRRNF